MEKTVSYTVQEQFPWKVLKHTDFIEDGQRGRIQPIHAHFLPTNKCNLNCPMCSFAKRNKQLQISLEDATVIINKLAELGCKAVTISGGGEPLVYPYIDDILQLFHKHNIKIGIATNGLLLSKIQTEILNLCTWIRISNDDSRTFDDTYRLSLENTVQSCRGVDWGFSHVVSNKPNYEEIMRIIDFSNINNFTHIGVVADLFDDTIDFPTIKDTLKKHNINDQLVIYKDQKQPCCGSDCYLGYLKPLIAPDCRVYACAGVQCSTNPPSYDFDSRLCIGDALKLDEMYENEQIPVDGSICTTCYYDGYNTMLKNLIKPIHHEEFV